MNNMKNRVQLIGNLGSTPEVKTVNGGSKMTRMSIATRQTYKNAKGEKIIETHWHNVIAWGKTAEIVEKYFTKGLEVMIGGKLVSRNYTDKEGNKRYATEVEANDVLILTRKQ